MTAHQFPIRVYYQDTDAGGIVYHGAYIPFAERARTEMMRDFGFEHVALLEEKNIGFVVRSMQLDYSSPARLDDLITVHSKIERIGGASFDIRQTIKRDDEILCDILVTLVGVEMQGDELKPIRVLQVIKDMFEKTK